uniref:Uncharacterized protein n=1 Tax=Arundo donax TaxID=35708 RepID=A0A0A9F2V4_ARUDO
MSPHSNLSDPSSFVLAAPMCVL